MSEREVFETIDKLLKPLLGSDELVAAWWKSPNRAFSYETPETMYIHDPHRVVNYVLGQYNADYS